MNGLERAFARMGARVEFDQWTRRNRFSDRIVSEDLALDVRQDRLGEYFLISRAPVSTTELVVLDVQPSDRHLLLLSRNGGAKHRFLLGHDERHWFVTGIPETTPVSRVRDAKQALKPDLVQSGVRGVRAKYRNRRSNAARIRQGEWFFIPAPDVRVEKFLLLRKEPIARGGGKTPPLRGTLPIWRGDSLRQWRCTKWPDGRSISRSTRRRTEPLELASHAS